jgi:chemotaxis regulatin CheY-phosphate phosphatase CheZ
VERKEETPVQRKKGKRKATKKPDEVDKALPMQVEEETEKKPIETVHVTAPPDSQTFKRLIRQLRDARKEVAQLKTEAMSDRVKMKELMDGYTHTLDLARFAARKAQPLHRQLQNLYRQNRGFQSQNRKLKAELQHFQDEVAQRNLQVLVEASIEKETSTVKESTTPLKNPVIAKKKKPVVPNEDPGDSMA